MTKGSKDCKHFPEFTVRASNGNRHNRQRLDRSARHGITALSGLNAILALGLVCFFGAHFLNRPDKITRYIEYLRAGSVEAEGFTVHLDPDDETITKVILERGVWEPGTTKVIRDLLKPGDVFIDVGANIGWFTLIASRAVGDDGRVIAFEPAPGSHAIMQDNIRRNACQNVTLEQKALSDTRGTLQLHLHKTNGGAHSTALSEERAESIDVDALPLDEYWKETGGEIALVKIDTEGAEGFILEGMRSILENQQRMAVIIEYHPLLFRKAGFDPAAVLNGFADLGYEIQAIVEPSGELVPIDKSRFAEVTELFEKNSAFANILLRRSPKAEASPWLGTESAGGIGSASATLQQCHPSSVRTSTVALPPEYPCHETTARFRSRKAS